MKVRYIGISSPLSLIHGEEYEVLSIERNLYRIVDEENEDYLYPPEIFEIVDEGDPVQIDDL